MTDAMDPMDEMEHLLSTHADQLLAGEVGSLDLPDEVVGLAGLLTTLRTGIDGDDCDALAEARVVATIAARIRSNASREHSRRGARVLGRRVSARAAAIGLVAVLASGGAAAAATGSLPDAVQRVVSHALNHFHIAVPDPDQVVDLPAAVTRNTEPASRGPAAAVGAAAAVNGTAPATRAGTELRPKSLPTTSPAHPSAAPTSTSRPNVTPASTSRPAGGTSTPANPSGNGNPSANGNANGSANGHPPANGKAKGNAPGNGKVTGTSPGNGKANGNGSGNGNGNGNGKAPAAVPPGKGHQPAV
jgi:hypothetical protein